MKDYLYHRIEIQYIDEQDLLTKNKSQCQFFMHTNSRMFTLTTCLSLGRNERSRFRRRTICFLRSLISVCNALQSSCNLTREIYIVF